MLYTRSEGLLCPEGGVEEQNGAYAACGVWGVGESRGVEVERESAHNACVGFSIVLVILDGIAVEPLHPTLCAIFCIVPFRVCITFVRVLTISTLRSTTIIAVVSCGKRCWNAASGGFRSLELSSSNKLKKLGSPVSSRRGFSGLVNEGRSTTKGCFLVLYLDIYREGKCTVFLEICNSPLFLPLFT